MLGRVLLEGRAVAEAATAFERVLELDPVDRTAMTFLAHGYEQLETRGEQRFCGRSPLRSAGLTEEIRR